MIHNEHTGTKQKPTTVCLGHVSGAQASIPALVRQALVQGHSITYSTCPDFGKCWSLPYLILVLGPIVQSSDQQSLTEVDATSRRFSLTKHRLVWCALNVVIGHSSARSSPAPMSTTVPLLLPRAKVAKRALLRVDTFAKGALQTGLHAKCASQIKNSSFDNAKASPRKFFTHSGEVSLKIIPTSLNSPREHDGFTVSPSMFLLFRALAPAARLRCFQGLKAQLCQQTPQPGLFCGGRRLGEQQGTPFAPKQTGAHCGLIDCFSLSFFSCFSIYIPLFMERQGKKMYIIKKT